MQPAHSKQQLTVKISSINYVLMQEGNKKFCKVVK